MFHIYIYIISVSDIYLYLYMCTCVGVHRIVKNFTIQYLTGYFVVFGQISGYLFGSVFYKDALADDTKIHRSSWLVVSF